LTRPYYSIMQTEYTTSIGYKIFYSAAGLAVTGAGLFFYFYPGKAGQLLTLLIPLLFVASGLLIIVNQFKRKIIITDNSIISVNVFKSKELPFDHIKGVRMGEKLMKIVPDQPAYLQISISDYISLGDSDGLIAWLTTNFKDLDAVELEQEKEKILNDTNLGFTEEDRKERISLTKGIAVAYNIVGMALGFIAIFIKDSYLAALLMLIYPLCGIVVMVTSRGLTKFLSNSKRSGYFFIILGFVMPIFIMLFKSLVDYNLFNYGHLWLPMAISAGVLFLMLVTLGINRSAESVNGQAVFMLIIAVIYGFGSSVQVNCVFDKSDPQPFKSTILGRKVEHSKGAHYHLILTPWEPGQKQQDVEVSRSFYQNHADGSLVNIDMKKGTLNIPWFYITK